MVSFSKPCIYKTFGLIELQNLSKDQLADRIINYEKAVFTNNGPLNIQLLESDCVNFLTFKQLLSKI